MFSLPLPPSRKEPLIKFGLASAINLTLVLAPAKVEVEIPWILYRLERSMVVENASVCANTWL